MQFPASDEEYESVEPLDTLDQEPKGRSPRASHASVHGRPNHSRASAIREGDLLLGKYFVERIAGRSGSAVVVEARHVDLDQRVILKYLPAQECAFPEKVSQFLRSARAALRLSSEHTARTLDAGRLPAGFPYVVTELVEGAELREVIQARGPLPITDAVDWVLQAAESVAEAHRHGLVHGSLNPSNLFVASAPDGSPRVQVLDYGVAEALRVELVGAIGFDADTPGLPQTQKRLRVLSATAPEQIRRSDDLDPQTDVWALGAILHEMLAGRPAFLADNITGLLAMIVADRPPPLSSMRQDITAALEALVLRCLEKDRHARFASIAELAAALKPFASSEARVLVDRITRTQGRNLLPGSSVPTSRALVYLGPTSAPPVSAPTPVSPRFQMMWSTGLVAFGLVGGAIAGSLATRGALSNLVAGETRTTTPASVVPATVNSVSIDSARPASEAEVQRNPGSLLEQDRAPLPSPETVRQTPARLELPRVIPPNEPTPPTATRLAKRTDPGTPTQAFTQRAVEPRPRESLSAASDALFDEMR